VRVSFCAVVIAACLAAVSVAAADQNDDVRVARQAVQDKDWGRAVAAWEQLYMAGSPEASLQLCRLYFDGRQGAFEANRTTDQCRRAAASGDAGALYRMGLLYIMGLGVDQNLDQAQALCSAALQSDPPVPARFCLAAVNHEKGRQDEALLRTLPASPSTAPTTDAGATASLDCERAFIGVGAGFDAAGAIRFCASAAASGDAAAQYRLGLIALVGLGGPRDLDVATTDCARAQAASNGDISAGFCTAAAAQLRQSAANLALSRATNSVDPDPTSGLPLPKTQFDPFAMDQFLDTPRSTSAGLKFTCRDINFWGMFEAPGLGIVTVRDVVFGRKLVDYQPADYQEIDRAAADCDAGVTAIDSRRVTEFFYRQFRESLPALRARQVALVAELRRSGGEVNQLTRDQPAYQSGRPPASR
jgi:hypothetical protein